MDEAALAEAEAALAEAEAAGMAQRQRRGRPPTRRMKPCYDMVAMEMGAADEFDLDDDGD